MSFQFLCLITVQLDVIISNVSDADRKASAHVMEAKEYSKYWNFSQPRYACFQRKFLSCACACL
jgi:hypothetical protein